MKIGLLDIDGHNFPNLSLMRISGYHKANGDDVEWATPFEHYDILYRAKVFTFTPEDHNIYNADIVIRGGTGYDIQSKLPSEIDNFYIPDYSIYPNIDYSINFYSRGCIRNCPFCLVQEKEGKIKPVEPMELNQNGKYIRVMDNNFFANPEWPSVVEKLKATKQPIELFGVDVRIIDKDQAAALNSMKMNGDIHIAWDLPEFNLTEKLLTMTEYIKPYKITCYVLVGYNSTIEEDLYRIYTLRKLGIKPFVQPFRDYDNKRQPTKYETDLARWANRSQLFKTIDFKDYRPRKGFVCAEYLHNKII